MKCKKCGSKLDERTGLCSNCDDISKEKKKKTGIKKLVVIAIISLVVVISALFLLTYFSIIDSPFVSSILSSIGINHSNNESDITFQNFDEEDIAFDNGELYVKSQLLITVDDSFTYKDVKKAVMNYDGNIVGAIRFTNDYQIEFDNKNYDELNNIAENLKKDLSGSDIGLHRVFYTEEDTSSNNNSGEIDGDWWRDAISLNTLEQRKISYSNINVGIFDTVFDTSNKDLSGVFKSEWQNYEVVKSQDHGTSVAGFISAKKNNDYGIDGISDNSNIYGFSFNGNNLYKYPTSVMKYKYAIAMMLNNNVKIINFSNGYDEICVGAQHKIKEACDELEEFSNSLSAFLKKYIDNDYDFLITKAAGNQNSQIWIECDISADYPYGVKSYDENEDGELNSCKKLPDAVYTPKYDIFGAITDENVKKHIIIVGAAESHGYKLTYYPAGFSARGERVDIYAPGENLKCLIPESDDGDSTTIAGGTSFSAPIVAGVASLVWGANPDLSAIDVRNAILNTASLDISGENKKMIDAYFAVNYALQIKNVKDDQNKSTGAVMGSVKVKDEELDIYASFANISFTKKETSTDTKIQADKNGLFDIILDSGDYVISVSLDGYNTFTREISVKNDDVIYIDDIFLSEENSYVSGKYLVDVDGKLICAKSNAIYYKESINSEEKKIAYAGNVSSLLSDGDTVYYVEGFDNSNDKFDEKFTPKKVYRAKVSGSKSDYIFTSKGYADLITYQDGCIYYLDTIQQGNSGYLYSLMKYDIDSDSATSLTDEWSGDIPLYWKQNIYALDNTIFFTKNNSLYSYDITSNKTELIISSSKGLICDIIGGKLCFEYTKDNSNFIAMVDDDKNVDTSVAIDTKYDLHAVTDDGKYGLFFTSGFDDFDLFTIDLKTGESSVSEGDAGSCKGKNYFVAKDLEHPENIYFMYSVRLYDENKKTTEPKKHDEFEINITKPMWIIDGYVVDWNLNTYKIYDETIDYSKTTNDTKTISSEEATKIALEKAGGSEQYGAVYWKKVQYEGKEYYLINIKWKVDDGNGKFHYSHIGYTIVSTDGTDVKSVDYINDQVQVY